MLRTNSLLILPLVVAVAFAQNGIGYYGSSNVRDQRPTYPQPLYRPRPLPLPGRPVPISPPAVTAAPAAPVTQAAPAAPAAPAYAPANRPNALPPAYSPGYRPLLNPHPIRPVIPPLAAPQPAQPPVAAAPEIPLVTDPQPPVVVDLQPPVNAASQPEDVAVPVLPIAAGQEPPIDGIHQVIEDPEPDTTIHEVLNIPVPSSTIPPVPEESIAPNEISTVLAITADSLPEPEAPIFEVPNALEPIAPQPSPADQPAPAAQPAPIFEPEPAPQPAPAPRPVPALQPVPAPQPAPAPKPVYAPQPTPEVQPAPIPQPEPIPEPAIIPEAEPVPLPVSVAQPELVALPPPSIPIAPIAPVAPIAAGPQPGALPPLLPKPKPIREPAFGRHPQPSTTSGNYYPTTATQAPSVTATHSQPAVTRPSGYLKFDFKCKDGNGYYPVQNECDTYIECKEDKAMKYSCPDGLHFNPEAKKFEYPCAYPSEVKCMEGADKQSPKPTDRCPNQYGFYSMNDGDCSKFIMCQEGLATVMNCPSGLAFNPQTSSCDWPANVPQCNPHAFDGFTCPDPPQDEDGTISDIIYKYRYNGQCKYYVACQRGHPRLLSCDRGLSFDEPSQSCVDEDYVTDCAVPYAAI